MRIFLTTSLPMLVLAVFILVGGTRLAQRDVEIREDVDHFKIETFAKAFSRELERLDELYINHLDEIAENYKTDFDTLTKAAAENTKGVSGVYLLSANREPKAFVTSSLLSVNELPEVAMEGQKVLNEAGAFMFPENHIKTIAQAKNSDWHERSFNSESQYLVRWVHSGQDRIVAIIVDKKELEGIVNESLVEWMNDFVAPLRSDSVICKLTHSSDKILFHNGSVTGNASLVIPFYSSVDEWKLMTWDVMTTTTRYDSATLWITSALAILVAICGLMLYQQQRRSFTLAQQRVSFVNQVSHELGSPLTNVALNLDLASELVANDNTKAKYRLGLIAQEIERLNRLVANVLTFSHHERGTLTFSSGSCDPNEIIEKLLESYQPALERKEIEVSFVPGEAVTVSTDSDAVVQIVANLLSNVEKYAFSGRYLSIKTFIRNDCSVISVEDNGPGIPKHAIDKVFKSFERVGSKVNVGASGAGLGLSIAKSLATELGGDLQLVSYENGCTFELSLPQHSIK